MAVGIRAREAGIDNSDLQSVITFLEGHMLIERSMSLNAILKMTADYVRSLFRPIKSLEGNLGIDPTTQMPNGVSGKVVFSEPDIIARKAGVKPMRELLSQLDRALGQSGYRMWLLLDRLDVAFPQGEETEIKALRALFKAYNDLNTENIKLKIFLRSDIWEMITVGGFREATHVASTESSVILSWDDSSLFYVFMKRLLNNDAFCVQYGVDREEILKDTSSQRALFNDIIPNKSISRKFEDSFRWIVSRITDGKGQAAPRELVQFMSALRARQIKALENGSPEPDGTALFDRSVFNDALYDVSLARIERTVYPEYPKLKPYIQALQGRKCRHSSETLARIWKVEVGEAASIALKLHNVGFLKNLSLGVKARSTFRFYIALLYRW